MARRKLLILISLAAIVAGATVIRFWDLATNPGGLYLDEASEALSAHRLLTEPGFHPIFFTDGGGREALFGYLVAGAFRLFGESTLTLRATAAAIGVATVPAIWLLARRFGEGAGLTAAGWTAASLWLIAISRDGMRNVLVPLLGALALASLIAWADQPNRTRAILAGAVTALAGFYAYQPLQLLPLLVALWLLWLRRVEPAAWATIRQHLPVLAIALLVVAAPMLVVAATDPVAYFGRAAGVSLVHSDEADIVTHTLRTLGMFTLTGDPNPRHDVGELPLLGWPVAALVLAGLLRLWRARTGPADALILWSLPVLLLPPLLATEGGAPHFLRSLGLAAPLAVTIGLGASELVAFLRSRCGPMASRAGVLAIAAGLLALAVGSESAYLLRPVADRYAAYRYDLVAMAADASLADAVILDDYSSTVVRFLDAGRLPTILAPGTRIAYPDHYGRILALSRDDLLTALGPYGAASTIVERDPYGEPTVWAVKL